MDNSNKGKLFKNSYKNTEKHPDYKGNCNVNGVDLEMSAWINQDKNGNNYMSITFQKPYVKVDGTKFEQTESTEGVAESFQEPQDDLPF